MSPTDPTCTAATPRGACRAKPMTGQPTCYLHGPDAQAARARGGQARAAKRQAPAEATLESPAEGQWAPDFTTGPKIVTSMDQIAKALAAGTMSANAASSLAALGRLALACLERDQQAQLDRLERLVAERAPKTAGRRR
jgi:hypothetical protein